MRILEYKNYIMNKKIKSARELERCFKGVANHWRIEILLVISKNPGIILDSISEILDCNIKTVSEHSRRLAHSGLINKKYKDRCVLHYLSPYGKAFINFIKSF